MADQTQNDLKYGINWAFLKTLLDMYEHMIIDQHTFVKSLSGNSGVNPRVAYCDFVASVFTFYSAVRHQFDPYLIKKNIDLKPINFISIIETITPKGSKQDMIIITMALELSHWSNSEGCFKTMTSNIDPMAPNHM